MTLAEKLSELLGAKSDEEKYAAASKLTKKQKDLLIVSFLKVI